MVKFSEQILTIIGKFTCLAGWQSGNTSAKENFVLEMTYPRLTCSSGPPSWTAWLWTTGSLRPNPGAWNCRRCWWLRHRCWPRPAIDYISIDLVSSRLELQDPSSAMQVTQQLWWSEARVRTCHWSVTEFLDACFRGRNLSTARVTERVNLLDGLPRITINLWATAVGIILWKISAKKHLLIKLQSNSASHREQLLIKAIGVIFGNLQM